MYATITSAKQVNFNGNINNYMTVTGYTKLAGAPTGYMVQVSGSNRWRRVYCIQRSNSGTHYININGSFKPVCIFDIYSAVKKTNNLT